MPDLSEITRRLRELWAGETQDQIGRRLGYTGSAVGQVQRGQRPSREFMERTIAAYELDREEWLGLAGYGASPPDPHDEIADAVVKKLLDAGVTSTPPAAAIIDAATRQELTYDPDFENVSVAGYEGAGDLTANDLEIVNRAVRALMTEQRRRQGRSE